MSDLAEHAKWLTERLLSKDTEGLLEEKQFELEGWHRVAQERTADLERANRLLSAIRAYVTDHRKWAAEKAASLFEGDEANSKAWTEAVTWADAVLKEMAK